MTIRPVPAPPRRSTGRLAAAVALGVLSLSACSGQYNTEAPYNPADGVAVELGNIKVLDLLVVSEGDGAAGAVIGSVVNEGQEPVSVQLTTQAGPLEPVVEVAPAQLVRLDGGVQSPGVTIPAVDVIAGATLPVQISVAGGEATQVPVPVLLPIGQYADVAPGDTAATTTAP